MVVGFVKLSLELEGMITMNNDVILLDISWAPPIEWIMMLHDESSKESQGNKRKPTLTISKFRAAILFTDTASDERLYR